ncbi:hypothetical protein MLD38_003956 [Melastoma candidum]|uniref:Uncharacterized protein n=1 Tax=Melastoma candidum TaxID=119954 RepID=A0ACB9S472_9MYRT|nr:hypothetical protein MLD38_003956 [Melastoma candidum]
MTIPNHHHRRRNSTTTTAGLHSYSCNRHPSSAPSPGFCASCLRERLSLIDPLSHPPDPSSFLRTRSSSLPSRSFHPSQPRRNSCDSRSHNTLSDLFVFEDAGPPPHVADSSSLLAVSAEQQQELTESRPRVRVSCRNEARNVEQPNAQPQVEEAEGEWKTVREFMDLEWESKKHKGRNAKGFWDVASSFSKKLRKWRHKETATDRRHGVDGSGLVMGGRGRGNADLSCVGNMQAEVGDYGLGRRSCDTYPRHSVDAGRLSLDGLRSSMDKPRASWDGCLVGRGCQYPQFSSNPMVSFLEDVRVIDVGFRNRMLVEGKIDAVDEVAWKSPGGCHQTRDYYDGPISVHRGRRSLDRLNSVRKGSLAEIDDRKLAMNGKISPAANELFYGAKLLIAEEDLRGSSSKSSVDDRMEGKDGNAVVGDIDEKLLKKLHKWGKAWKVWDLIQRRSESKLGSEESFPTKESGHRQGPTESEALRKLRIVAQGDANGAANQRFVSARNSFHGDGPSLIGGFVENKSLGMNGRDELWQRNRNVKQSPNNLDNGLLRFYLTPARSYRTKHVRGKARKV